MKVVEIKVKILMKEDVHLKDIRVRICSVIDYSFSRDKEILELHNNRGYKYYCFDIPYLKSKDKIYKKGSIHTFNIRTMNIDLAEFFSNYLIKIETYHIKILSTQVKFTQKRHIEKIYSLTPVIIKQDNSFYWKDNMTISQYEKRLKENLIKKYNTLLNTKIDENFEIFNNIVIENDGPIPVKYKDITKLGDKLTIYISENETAQNLAYLALGCGLGEMNSRGFGFLNYKYINL